MLIIANYMDDFLAYYERAKILNDRNARLLPPETLSGCPLQDIIPIYDTVYRNWAGFGKVLEDLWKGPDVHHAGKRKAKASLQGKFSRMEWLYIFLAHRCTGSGASFEKDHGYRNNVIIQMAESHERVTEMADFLLKWEGAMFTSIGNQPPPFNKPEAPYKTAGRQYLHKVAPVFVRDLEDILIKADQDGVSFPIRTLVDWCLNWHKSRGMKRYVFVLTAFVMDIAEYFPEVCDKTSPVYLGANAQKAMDMIFMPANGNRQKWLDAGMDYLVAVTGGNHPYNIEDVLCDFIRYVENYIPEEYIHEGKTPLRVPCVLDLEKQLSKEAPRDKNGKITTARN